MSDDVKLRQTFDQEAELYHYIRPRYPSALFSRLLQVTGLEPPAELLEIGPGTGQATAPLAQCGYHITAIELGTALAAVARRELQIYPNAQVITGAFEDIDLPPRAYDLVYAATAFHWVKPEVRFTKPHQLLKPTGHLALINTHHVSDGNGDAFFHASQPIYDKYYANDGKDKPTLPAVNEVASTELDPALFKPVDFSRFPVTMYYEAHTYAQLLNTYSPTLSLRAAERQGFLTEIEDLINREFKGAIAKHFVMSLTVAKPVT